MSEVEQLRCQLAQAEARAMRLEEEVAQAHAEAAAAKLALAKKSAQEAQDSELPEVPAALSTPAHPNGIPTENLRVADIRSGYNFAGLTIGSLVDEAPPNPPVQIKIPYATFSRHLLISGAPNSGRSQTLQLLVEGLTGAGIPVVLCNPQGALARNVAKNDTAQHLSTCATVENFGPVLLARALCLNTAQEQALQLVFEWAGANNYPLRDLQDLRSAIEFLASDAGKKQLEGTGGVSSATGEAIIRAVTSLEEAGVGVRGCEEGSAGTESADKYFGKSGFDTVTLAHAASGKGMHAASETLMHATSGKGTISLLPDAHQSTHPALVPTVATWMLADLAHNLPEWDASRHPRLVFFFEDARRLFNGASKEFLNRVAQVVRTLKSKGVGVIFSCDTPKDIPTAVLAQVGSRIQHALPAASLEEQKKLKALIATFPETSLDLEELLPNLEVGEAVVTVVDDHGHPTPLARTKLLARAFAEANNH